MTTGDPRLEAVLNLDPSMLSEDESHVSHPAVLYDFEPWSGSGVVAFPSSRQRSELARIAVGIVDRRGAGGMTAALENRARELHAAQIPQVQAKAELRTMYRAVQNLVDVLSVNDGANHG